MGPKTLFWKIFLFFVLFNVFFKANGKLHRELIPEKECEKISGVEVRYNEFYELYLGNDEEKGELQKHGIVYKSLNKAVNACCPGMEVNFTLVNTSVEWLVQEDILHHHGVQNNSHLVFYFPEFTSQGKLGKRTYHCRNSECAVGLLCKREE